MAIYQIVIQRRLIQQFATKMGCSNDTNQCFYRMGNQSDFVVLYNVAHILEQSVPLMDHPGEGFLVQLEEDMMKLVLKHGMLVSAHCWEKNSYNIKSFVQAN